MFKKTINITKEDQENWDYGSARSIMDAANDLPEKYKRILIKKLNGSTLKEIGDETGISKERVRQLVEKAIFELRTDRYTDEADRFFKEDRYGYLFETYDIGKRTWDRRIGLPEYIYNFLQIEYDHGSASLDEAENDAHLSEEIKRAIAAKKHEEEEKHRIHVNGETIPKTTKGIERYILKKYFKDEGTYSDYREKYTEFLREHGLEHDKKLAISPEDKRSKENALTSSEYVLWKQKKRLRYYDIPGTDFTELYEELDLRQYHNIEISSMKLMKEHPELMKKYDIRDEYELHNLLKKTCDREKCDRIVFERMPSILFGRFRREEAVTELFNKTQPITRKELTAKLSEMYGYAPIIIRVSWLGCINRYYEKGIYRLPGI